MLSWLRSQKLTRPKKCARQLRLDRLLFGESRVQEARAKIPELPSNVRWHFVGHLQKNKIRHALPLFEMIHSVDSLALAQDINRIAEEEGLHPRVLLEVNVAGEGSKFGFIPRSFTRPNGSTCSRCRDCRSWD